MNYQQFIEEVERRVKEKIKGNETITVYIHTAVKNNGKERKGITVSEKGIHISPTIYLEEYFQQFQEGKPIEKIVEKILQLYEEVKCSHPCEESLLQNYEELKGKFACKLIHRGKNEKLLNDIPYVPGNSSVCPFGSQSIWNGDSSCQEGTLGNMGTDRSTTFR